MVWPRQWAMRIVAQHATLDDVPEHFRAWVQTYLDMLKRRNRPKLIVKKQPYA